MNSLLRPGAAFLLFVAVLTPLIFWRLGATDLVSMEGIVADGARTMVSRGEYSVPRLHGEIYSYKPPLAYWLAAASHRLTGAETEFTLRFPFALTALLMALGVWGIVGSRLGLWSGWLCGVASVSGILTVQKLRMAEFDMPLAAGVGLAATLAMADFASDRPSYRRWIAAYLCLAIAFLTKGMPALMFFGPGLLLAAWWTGSFRRLFSPAHFIGGIAFCLVAGAWIGAAWLAEGAAAFAQPLAEANEKGLSWNLEAVAQTLLKPAVLVGCFFPWALLLPIALGRGRLANGNPKLRVMSLAAAGFTIGGLATFMAVPATETRYLLPLAAPAGIWGALVLLAHPQRARQWASVMTIVLGTLLAAAAPWAAISNPWPISNHSLVFIFLFGALLAGSGLVLRRPIFNPMNPACGAAVCMVLVALVVGSLQVGWVGPHRASSRSLLPVAESFEPYLANDDVLWVGPVSAHWHHSSLFFYLRRPVRTFQGNHLPPVGSAVVLFNDEPPGLEAAPFAYTVLDQRRRRQYELTLVRVTDQPADGSARGLP